MEEAHPIERCFAEARTVRKHKVQGDAARLLVEADRQELLHESIAQTLGSHPTIRLVEPVDEAPVAPEMRGGIEACSVICHCASGLPSPHGMASLTRKSAASNQSWMIGKATLSVKVASRGSPGDDATPKDNIHRAASL